MYSKGDFLCHRTCSMSMDGWDLGRTSILFTVLARAQLGSDLAMAFVANANYTHVNYELRSVLKSMRILNVTKCITFIDEIEKVACQ